MLRQSSTPDLSSSNGRGTSEGVGVNGCLEGVAKTEEWKVLMTRIICPAIAYLTISNSAYMTGPPGLDLLIFQEVIWHR